MIAGLCRITRSAVVALERPTYFGFHFLLNVFADHICYISNMLIVTLGLIVLIAGILEHI